MLKHLILFVLCTKVLSNFNECTFEEDECGWFGGESIGVGSWVRVTTQELIDGGTDVHPSRDAMGGADGLLKNYSKWDQKQQNIFRSLHVCSY